MLVLAPGTIRPENRDRLLVHMHGGCYVLNPGEAGLPAAIFLAGTSDCKVIEVDYACRRKPTFRPPSKMR